MNCSGKLLLRIFIFPSLIPSFIRAVYGIIICKWFVRGSKIVGLPIDLRTDINKHLQYNKHPNLCFQKCVYTEGDAGRKKYLPSSLGLRDGRPGRICGPCKADSGLGVLEIWGAPVGSPLWVKIPRRKHAVTSLVHIQERTQSGLLHPEARE